jgi:hypothetical protein
MSLGQPGPSLIHLDAYAHALTVAGGGDTVPSGIPWKPHFSGLISA